MRCVLCTKHCHSPWRLPAFDRSRIAALLLCSSQSGWRSLDPAAEPASQAQTGGNMATEGDVRGAAAQQLSRGSRFKELMRRYGKIALGVHLAVYASFFAGERTVVQLRPGGQTAFLLLG